MGGFGRVGKGWKGLGVPKLSNCIENSCLGELGRIWADLEMKKVCNCYQIHRQRATQATQGAAKGCQRVPEDDNMDPIWSPNGGGGRAVTTDFFPKKMQKNIKRCIRCSTRRKRETVIENETSPFEATAKRRQSVRPRTLQKVAKV